jgi:acetyl esterase/lipase
MWELLWPNGVPLAAGNGDEDRPAVVWYPAPAALEGKRTAAIVVCPGGGYARRADHEGEPIALWLNTLGISAAVLRYRVGPYRAPAPQLDALRAVRYVRSQAEGRHVDPTRIGILGFSAGGHLACSSSNLGDDGAPDAEDLVERYSSRVQAAILCYPVVSMGEFAHEGSRTNLLGGEPDRELVERYSGENMVHELTPPTFVWHTADDGAVPVENALLYALALRRKGIPHELHVFESGRHGLGLAQDNPEVSAWTGLCAAWLRKMGFADWE